MSSAFVPTEVNDIRIENINASADRGGWEARLVSLSDTDQLERNQNVVINYKGYHNSHSLESTWRVAFDGHVIPVQFSFDLLGSEATFLAQTSDGYLRHGWLQGIGFRDVTPNSRSNYHQFDAGTWGVMTMGRIVKHLLGYYDNYGTPPSTNPDWVAHTNMVYHATGNPMGWVDTSNITTLPFDAATRPNGSMEVVRYIVRETNNLWSTIQSIATNEFFVTYFDKNNDIYYRRHPMFDAAPPAAVMTFDEDFAVGRPIVDVRNEQFRQVKLHAVTDDATTIHSTYPVSPVHIYGNVHEQTYLRCNDQDTLDWWAEVMYGWLNRPYTVRWTAPGLVGLLFEIHDPVYITYTGTSANGVHINWVDQKFWIREINVQPDNAFSGQTTFTLEADYGMAP